MYFSDKTLSSVHYDKLICSVVVHYDKQICSVVVDFLFIVTPIVGVCNCSTFCCTLLYVHSSIEIILMGKRELVALFDLILYVHSTIFQLCGTVLPGFNQY